MNQVIIGYTAEGSTDEEFLESIIERTFIDVGFECRCQIEVLTPIIKIKKPLGIEFVPQIYECTRRASNNGIMVLCIHVDADDVDDVCVFSNKINPVLTALHESDDEDICHNVIALVPVQMTEAWMLADKTLLKEEIGTEMSDDELHISRVPETISDPKSVISDAIRIARSPLSKRRRNTLTISELYQPIGRKISIKELETLPSFLKFKEAVRDAYRYLHYL